MKKIVVFFGVLLVLALMSTNSFAQCAMCRGTVESSMGNGRNNVGVGLNTGIVYLFVMPYLLVAVIGYLWYRSSKKAQRERDFVTSRVQQAFQVK
jgi:CHASE3 domain sensor protein